LTASEAKQHPLVFESGSSELSCGARMLVDVILQGGAGGQPDEGFLQNVNEGDGIPLCQTLRCRDQRQMVRGNWLGLQGARLKRPETIPASAKPAVSQLLAGPAIARLMGHL
jgi:hypothetical protein